MEELVYGALYEIDWDSKVTPSECQAISKFFAKIRVESNRPIVYRHNACLISQEFKNNRLSLNIKSPLEYFPKKTLELILISSGVKYGKSI